MSRPKAPSIPYPMFSDYDRFNGNKEYFDFADVANIRQLKEGTVCGMLQDWEIIHRVKGSWKLRPEYCGKGYNVENPRKGERLTRAGLSWVLSLL